MSIVKRISRLVKADIHAVLDMLEDPQAVLEQAIREMEEIVERHEEEERASIEHTKRLDERSRQIAREVAELEGRSQIAIDSGNIEMARPLVRRVLELKKEGQAADALRERSVADRKAREESLKEERERLARMKERLVIVSNSAEQPHAGSTGSSVREEEVESEILRLQSNRSEKHARGGKSQ
ncbi:MAG: PspA/IM30 family protein [Deltaproteobacteria bacterium]|nr:PspA/IM30 family protein [Deltaproteobacteria bacterium]